MKRNLPATLLALVLLAGLVACGLLVPSAFLHRQEQALLNQSVSLHRDSISPYGVSTIASDRIARLSDRVNWEALYFRTMDETQVTPREPLSGELSLTDADAVGQSILEQVASAPEQRDTTDTKWVASGSTLYSFQKSQDLSFWVLQYTCQPEKGDVLGVNLCLDAVSGLPFMILVENHPSSSAISYEMVHSVLEFYEKAFDLDFTETLWSTAPQALAESSDAAMSATGPDTKISKVWDKAEYERSDEEAEGFSAVCPPYRLNARHLLFDQGDLMVLELKVS
jgi:hypothetical protein